VLLVGFEPTSGVFALWDAGLYRAIPYSRNVQIKAETLVGAYARGIALQRRLLWGTYVESIVAALPTRMLEALEVRMELTRQRLTGGSRA